MSWAELSGAGVRFQPSLIESSRFGLSVSRLVVGVGTPLSEAMAAVEQILQESPDDLVIVRYPGERAALGSSLAASGRLIIPADVLMYWEVPSRELSEADQVTPGTGEVQVKRGHEANPPLLEAVEQVVADSFGDYVNHYSANSRLDTRSGHDGYLEWARLSALDRPSDVFLIRDGDRAIGVALVAVADGSRDLEVVLAGLIRSAQGQGHYAALLQAVGQEAVERGCGRVIISTQAHNVIVQRAWARLGFRPFAAIATVHAMRSI